MAGVNKVILVGRLGKDPELRTVEKSSSKVATFSLATSETYKDKTSQEKKETTEWHQVKLWNRLAEIASKYLHKGDLVYVEGKMRTRSWEKDNITRYSTEVIADHLTMLSTPGGSGASSSGVASDPDEDPFA